MVNIQSYIGLNKDGIRTFYVDAEFDSGWVEGMSISNLAIGCEKAYTIGAYPDTSENYWEKTYERTPVEEDSEDDSNPYGDVVNIHEEIPVTELESEILVEGGHHLWVVYIKVDYDLVNPVVLANLPCRDQKIVYITITYDCELDCIFATKITRALSEDMSCSLPLQYLNEVLKVDALKRAIECGDLEKAMGFFTKFFSKKSSIRIKKGGCGCNERKTA